MLEEKALNLKWDIIIALGIAFNFGVQAFLLALASDLFINDSGFSFASNLNYLQLIEIVFTVEKYGSVFFLQECLVQFGWSLDGYQHILISSA